MSPERPTPLLPLEFLQLDAFVPRDEQLSRSQKDVAAHILHVLDVFASEGTAPTLTLGDFSFAPSLDERRYANVVLIDGPRGVGKTTVMLYVLASLFSRLPSQNRHRNAPGDPPAHTILPTRILDLRPYPAARPMILQIPATLETIISELEVRRMGSPLAASGPMVPPLRSRQHWNALVRSASLGWTESSHARTRIELSEYFDEVERSARAQAEFRDQFRAFVDAVCDDCQQFYRLRSQPLFLVPIDDADMNPQRCVEALDLMRMLWHPRVVYLLTGDTHLFKLTLRNSFFSQLTPPLPAPTALTEDTAQHAHELATATFDKIIPKRQRLRIEMLTATDRLARLFGGDDNSRMQQLRAFLDKHQHTHAALPSRLRGLEQFRSTLRSRITLSEEGNAQADLATLAYELWRHNVEDDQAPVAAVDELLDSVALDGATLTLHPRRAHVLAWYRSTTSVANTTMSFGPQFDLQPSAVPALDESYNAFIRSRRSPARPRPTLMPAPLVAAFLLCLEVKALDSRLSEEVPLTAPAVAVSKTEDGEDALTIPWPIPPWQSPDQLYRFDSTWSDISTSELKNSDGVLSLYIKALHHAFIGAKPAVERHELLKALVAHRPLKDWAPLAFALLASPDYGLSYSLATELLSTVGTLTPRRVELTRIDMLYASTPLDYGEARNFVQATNSAHPDHPFVRWANAERPGG